MSPLIQCGSGIAPFTQQHPEVVTQVRSVPCSYRNKTFVSIMNVKVITHEVNRLASGSGTRYIRRLVAAAPVVYL